MPNGNSGLNFKATSGSVPPTYLGFLQENDKPANSRDSAASGYAPNFGRFRGDFMPAQIPGLVQWIDPSNPLSIQVDGSGNVSRCLDLSGNGNDWFQPRTTNRPVYVTSSAQQYGNSRLNDNNVIHYNQAASPNTPHMIFRRDNQRILPAEKLTLFFVWQPHAVGISSFQGFYVCTANSTWNTGFAITGGGAGQSVLTWINNYVANFVSKDTTGVAGSAFITTMLYDQVNVTQLYTGSFVGADPFTGALSHGATTVSGSIGVYFGTDSTTTFGPSSGSSGESLLFDRALNSSEIREVQRYLGRKWNISTNL